MCSFVGLCALFVCVFACSCCCVVVWMFLSLFACVFMLFRCCFVVVLCCCVVDVLLDCSF